MDSAQKRDTKRDNPSCNVDANCCHYWRYIYPSFGRFLRVIGVVSGAATTLIVPQRSGARSSAGEGQGVRKIGASGPRSGAISAIVTERIIRVSVKSRSERLGLAYQDTMGFLRRTGTRSGGQCAYGGERSEGR